MRRLVNTESRAIPVVFFAFLLLIWQLIVDKGIIARYILPTPKDIFITLIEILPEIKIHIFTTVYEALLGFFISIVFAMVLAIIMDNVRIVKRALYPLLVISQTIPIIALAPLFILWFGFGKLPKIIVVVLVCFFPIIVSMLQGLESVDEDMINLLKSMGASKIQIFKMVKFPGAIVSFFSGLRIAATYSIMGAVIGEWLGGKTGIGVYMIRVKNSFALDKFFAAIVIIVILSITVFKVISLIEYIAMPWKQEINNKG
ncbi:ABC transporter permease [Clostridiisalibacter paucivorans]|uniref:ABC transporter permease n=1 Tax=Clostridiisalibacter paucivorans TaxID=408753 RepID=UPI0004790CE7|nr:ABC transporter permease [Clostridiisalibacter paucivorans]